MLEKEFQYYLKNQKELVSKYNGKYIVIVDEKVEGVFDTQIDAYNDSVAKFKIGTFLIQYCTPGNAAYTQTFHSRVVFT